MNMLPPKITETLPNNITFDMLLIEGGEFDMGGADEEASPDEKPVHRVKVSSFYLGQYSVTQAVWKAVMKNNPSNFKGDQRPVENVSWEDTQEFLKKLNQITGKQYRLPTEAEWEYAARGGVRSGGYVYAGSDKLKAVGWYFYNSDNETREVGLKYPNELGLYDMSGNVREWCEDHWHSNYEGAPDDGSAWLDRGQDGAPRVLRGGTWIGDARLCRVASRLNGWPAFWDGSNGFRLALARQ